MNNINEEYCILYLTFAGFNYKLSNVKNYVKLNILSKGLNLIASKKELISYGNIIYWSIVVNLNDNIQNYEKLESIYDTLIEDGLKNNYVPIIRIVTEDYSSNLENIQKDDYKTEDTKKLFLRKFNSH